MRPSRLRRARLVAVAAALAGCGGGSTPTSPASPGGTGAPPSTGGVPTPPPPPPATVDTAWDVATLGVPRLLAAHYIELAHVQAISRFRSGVGHDYSDDAERCRSMKHYFRPTPGTDWSRVRIFAPVSGRVTRVLDEWAGVQLQLRSSAYPAFTVVLFHVAPGRAIAVGDSLTAGEAIGTHVGTQTTSDVAVWVALPGRRRGLVSYVDALPDSLRAPLVARGAPRDSLVIARAQRDAAPLACDGETFTGADALPQWVVLR